MQPGGSRGWARVHSQRGPTAAESEEAARLNEMSAVPGDTLGAEVRVAKGQGMPRSLTLRWALSVRRIPYPIANLPSLADTICIYKRYLSDFRLTYTDQLTLFMLHACRGLFSQLSTLPRSFVGAAHFRLRGY